MRGLKDIVSTKGVSKPRSVCSTSYEAKYVYCNNNIGVFNNARTHYTTANSSNENSENYTEMCEYNVLCTPEGIKVMRLKKNTNVCEHA